ncbi:MAG TPA: hypothetical protein VGM56_16375 [Byssovorax sp.]|jgi:hypothetical protein
MPVNPWLQSIPWDAVMQKAKDDRGQLEKQVKDDRQRAAAARPNVEARDLTAHRTDPGRVALACTVATSALVDGFTVTGLRMNGADLVVENTTVTPAGEGQRQIEVIARSERELAGALDVTLTIDDHGQPRTVHAFGVA